MSTRKNAGFTLLETAMIILVGGLLVASTLGLIKIALDEVRSAITKQRMDAVDLALSLYANTHGYMPCPSFLNLKVDDLRYGRILTMFNVCGDTGVTTGGLPVRDLGLPDKYGNDGWGNRFTYAVSAALTTHFASDFGVIRIIDSVGNVITNKAPYVVVSHGKNGSCAHRSDGSAPVALPYASSQEITNCDTTTSANGVSDGLYRASLLGNTNRASGRYFDDYLRFQLPPEIQLIAAQQIVPVGMLAPFVKNDNPWFYSPPRGWSRTPYSPPGSQPNIPGTADLPPGYRFYEKQ